MGENRVSIIITTDASGAVTGFQQVGKESETLKKTVSSGGGPLAPLTDYASTTVSSLNFVMATVRALTSGLLALSAVKIGMEHETAMVHLRGVFREGTDEITRDLEVMNERMNHYFSFTQLADAASHVSDLLDTIDLDIQNQLTLLNRAADIAKSRGFDLEETMAKVGLAIAGSTKGAKQIGVNIADSYMQFTAWGGQLAEIWTKLSDTSKAYDRYLQIMIQTTKYEGDAEKQTTTLGGSLKVLTNTLHDQLGPELADMCGLLAKFVNLITEAVRKDSIDQKIATMRARISDVTSPPPPSAASAFSPFYGPNALEQKEEMDKQLLARGTHTADPLNTELFLLLRQRDEMQEADQKRLEAAQAIAKIPPKTELKPDVGGTSGGGASPIDVAQLSQKIFAFNAAYTKMCEEVTNENYNLWIQMAENSSDYYKAEDLKVSQWADVTKAKYAEQAAAAQQKLTELQLSLNKKDSGATQGAKDAVALEIQKQTALIAKLQELGGVIDQQVIQKYKELQKVRLQDTVTEKQLNVDYATLTGSMEEQLRTQIALIQATKDKNVAEARIPEIAEAYKKIADEQQRLASLRLNGSYFDGLIEGAEEAGRQLPTAFDQGKAAIDSLKNGISSAADALADFTMTEKLDVTSFANSFIKDLIRMQYQAMLTQMAFGGSGGGIAGFLGSLFGGSSSAGSSSSGSSFANFNLGGSGLGGIPGFDSGGDFSSGKTIMVGEEGPELLRLKSGSGSIIPNSQTRSAAASNLNVQVKIDNQSSTPLKLEQGPIFKDADKWVIQVVAKDIVEGGPLGKDAQ